MRNKKLIEVGKIYTYIEFCKLIGESSKIGSSKKAQLKEWKRHFDFTLEGRNIVINEIYKKLKPKEDKRVEGNHKCKELKGFEVKSALENCIGVYKIVLKNEIYIGSTTQGFRKRFLGHTYKDNKLVTKEMLDNGATFEILQICDGMTENEIRHSEDEWIKYFRSNPEWVVVNTLDHVQIKGEKQKYKTIKVKEQYYDYIMELLKNIEYDIF